MKINGQMIKTLRDERGWSLSRLAEEATRLNPRHAPPVTRASINNMERELVDNPGFWNVEGLARAFGVKADTLFKVEA